MPVVDVNGSKIAYTEAGAGRAVTLIHAFPLHSGMWEPQVESLAERYRLVSVDLKGFGASDAPDDPSSYSMDSYADEIAAVLDAAEIESTVLVGLSIGGYISFAFMRRHPQRVSALVLADTRAESDPPEGITKRTSQQDQVRKEGTRGLIEALATALLSEPTRSKKPDVVERTKALMDNPPAGFVGALEAMKNRPDSTDDLTSIRVPALVIVGENDAVTPVEASRKLHEHIGGSRLVVLPEAGHLSSLEAPEAFTGALAEFLGEGS